MSTGKVVSVLHIIRGGCCTYVSTVHSHPTSPYPNLQLPCDRLSVGLSGGVGGEGAIVIV
jgi:hypothetical protein